MPGAKVTLMHKSRLASKLLPRGLTAQLIILLLMTLTAAQALSVWVYIDERDSAVRAASRAEIVARTAAMVRLLRQTPEPLHERVVRSASGPRLRFWTSAQTTAPDDLNHPRLQQALNRMLDGTSADTRVLVTNAAPGERRRIARAWRQERRGLQGQAERQSTPRQQPDDHRERAERRRSKNGPHRRNRQPVDLLISVNVSESLWLNVETVLPTSAPVWASGTIATIVASAIGIVMVVVFVVRRVTRATAALADAAVRFGRGEAVASIPVQGPEDVRVAIRAFNDMREQLTRFVRSRTQMLAAISHDLRTPLTALRVRAELIEDGDNRQRMQTSIDEMSAMVESALDFARAASSAEASRVADLNALADSICEDLRDLGEDVTFTDGEPLVVPCRPLAIRRALRNVIDNALKHAGSAQVRAHRQGMGIEVQVLDRGPGIPEESLARVIEPFVRLESSRSRETGGVGMGLAIAASTARDHGGDLKLANRDGGGLEVTLRLPDSRTE